MDEMTLDEWRGLLDAAVNVASTRRLFLSISGGEPLLQDFTPDLIAYARRVGISEVAIITNGLLLDSNMVHRLETAGLTNLAISLDGATESVNDRVRGRGVFASVMRALRILQGSTIRVNLNITVMRMNADDLLQHLQEIATKFPNVDISLGQYVVEGRGVAFAREAAMPRPESDTVVRQLARIVSTTRFPLPPARTHSCGYGDTVVVYSNGDLAPCITPQFKRGNVRREGVEAFAKILREAATADVDTLPLCRVCDLRYICGGKCHQGQVARFGRALQNQCSDTYRNNFYRTLTMRVSSGG
jgi:radical SAM protein with 4Fe4S-binding SPASM domain